APEISMSNGIQVDANCPSSVPAIYAAGDAANHMHPPSGRSRVEHYNSAEKQGAAAARSMLGSGAEFGYVHTFWSDQYEHKLEYVGHVRQWDGFVVRGSVRDRKLTGFYLAQGVLRAAAAPTRAGD